MFFFHNKKCNPHEICCLLNTWKKTIGWEIKYISGTCFSLLWSKIHSLIPRNKEKWGKCVFMIIGLRSYKICTKSWKACRMDELWDTLKKKIYLLFYHLGTSYLSSRSLFSTQFFKYKKYYMHIATSKKSTDTQRNSCNMWGWFGWSICLGLNCQGWRWPEVGSLIPPCSLSPWSLVQPGVPLKWHASWRDHLPRRRGAGKVPHFCWG